MKISNLFTIEYPKTLIFSELTPSSNGINFVSSQGSNNSVVCKVTVIDGVKIYPAGVITVPLKGTVLAAHVQTEPCYVAHQIAVLTAKLPMTLQEKLFYCACIKKNAFRFSYGRQADKTLKDIELPNTIPEWAMEIPVSPITTRNTAKLEKSLDVCSWKEFCVGDIFDILNGKGITKEEIEQNPGDYEAIQSGEENNGCIGFIDKNYCLEKKYTLVESPCLTVARSGSAGFVSYHQNGCVIGDSTKALLLKDSTKRTPYIYLFLRTILMTNKFKYTYGRKVTENKYSNEIIMLPVDSNNLPDWDFMEDYIKSLPYADRI